MATAHPLPPPASAEPHHPAGGNETVNNQANQALVALPPREQEERDPGALSAPVALLPVELDVALPVREFRVRNLLALRLEQVIESQWGHGEDVPLASGEVQLAWSEFEVVDTQLAVRLTRLV
jgi:flagellar motor switch/type III secretory pathway protein FliN